MNYKLIHMAQQTKFGISQVNNTTPRWANTALLLTITLTTVAAFVIASDPGIADAIKVRIAVYLKGFDMLIAGVSRLFGIELPVQAKPK